MAVAAPVTDAAANPASDLRGAKGSSKKGTRRGRGVLDPKRRPNVEAAVSAQARLCGDRPTNQKTKQDELT
jgi:hypothetical protein